MIVEAKPGISIGMRPFSVQPLACLLRKLGALLLLAAIALAPIAIVVLGSKSGGIWVAGYVAGMVTVPLVAIGAWRAILELTEDVGTFLGFILFGLLVTLISAAAALWSIFG